MSPSIIKLIGGTEMYDTVDAGFMAALSLFWLICMALAIVVTVAMWKIFKKAGEPGVYSIIPIYNTMVMARLGGMESWLGLLVLVPGVGPFMAIYIMYKLFVDGFKLSVGQFIVLCLLFPVIGYPLIAFSDKYQYTNPLVK